jgi:CRISPR/Cas system endoribonuclease Cas6 (RAMP superfamily)
VLVFRHYLSAWDTFAPRELWINFNLLDAVQYHVALGEHRLETRHIQWGNKRTVAGFLGGAVYMVHRWQKLGAEFLGHLQMLARFGVFCSTGEGAARGLGQTRLLKGRVR